MKTMQFEKMALNGESQHGLTYRRNVRINDKKQNKRGFDNAFALLKRKNQGLSGRLAIHVIYKIYLW